MSKSPRTALQLDGGNRGRSSHTGNIPSRESIRKVNCHTLPRKFNSRGFQAKKNLRQAFRQLRNATLMWAYGKWLIKINNFFCVADYFIWRDRQYPSQVETVIVAPRRLPALRHPGLPGRDLCRWTESGAALRPNLPQTHSHNT